MKASSTLFKSKVIILLLIIAVPLFVIGYNMYMNKAKTINIDRENSRKFMNWKFQG